MSRLSLAYPYGETEVWGGKGTGLGVYGCISQSETQARALCSDLLFYGSRLQVHTRARRHTGTHFSKQENGKEMCLPLKGSCLFCLFCVHCLCVRRRGARIPALPYIRRLLSQPGSSHSNRAKMETGSSV